MRNFDTLSLDDRVHILQQGRYLLGMNYYGFRLTLFVLANNKLAEIWHREKDNFIVDIRLTEQGDLEKWLNRINLRF